MTFAAGIGAKADPAQKTDCRLGARLYGANVDKEIVEGNSQTVAGQYEEYPVDDMRRVEQAEHGQLQHHDDD